MQRKTFFTIVAFVATAIGCAALFIPAPFLQEVKAAAPSETANVMARTVGILLVFVGLLNFLVRDHEDSPTLRAVCLANLFLQIGIMPIDPLAFFSGVFHSLGAFVPNTILHVVLASGFAFFLAQMGRNRMGRNRRYAHGPAT